MQLPSCPCPFAALCHQQQGSCANANCPRRQGNAPGTGESWTGHSCLGLGLPWLHQGRETPAAKGWIPQEQRGRAALALVEFKSGLLRRAWPSAPALLIICRLESPRKEQNSSWKRYLRQGWPEAGPEPTGAISAPSLQSPGWDDPAADLEQAQKGSEQRREILSQSPLISLTWHQL